MDKTATLNTAKKVLETDMSCKPGGFDRTGVFIYPARKLSGARRFPFRDRILALASFGTGVVIGCSDDRLEWAKANLGHKSRDELFEGDTFALIHNYVSPDEQFAAGPNLKYLCSLDTFIPAAVPAGLEIGLLGMEETDALYPDGRFENAMGRSQNAERPRSLAAVASERGKIIGMASSSEDCDEMWQIGVDILPEYRGRGIGRAIVSRVTSAIFEAGKVPYYSTWTVNIASRKLAIGVGYWPAWVEVYAADNSERHERSRDTV